MGKREKRYIVTYDNQLAKNNLGEYDDIKEASEAIDKFYTEAIEWYAIDKEEENKIEQAYDKLWLVNDIRNIYSKKRKEIKKKYKIYDKLTGRTYVEEI